MHVVIFKDWNTDKLEIEVNYWIEKARREFSDFRIVERSMSESTGAFKDYPSITIAIWYDETA